MKALILTYDKNRPLTNHMIFKYEQIWPNHPFRFRIPYQEKIGIDNNRHEFIKTPVDIKNTILYLINDLPDEEWVYWSIDDKYPIELNINELTKLHSLIISGKMNEIDSIQFCHKKHPLPERNNQTFKDENGNIYFKKADYRQYWIHRFTKVRVIRSVFERFPDLIPNAKFMDSIISKLPVPSDQNFYITSKSFAYFGESGARGSLTRNCYISMKKNNFPTAGFKIKMNHYYYIGRPSKFILSNYNIRYFILGVLQFCRNSLIKWKKAISLFGNTLLEF